MSLDKTLENVNISLDKLTADVSSLLTTIQIVILIVTGILLVMAVAFIVLCCYVKCKSVNQPSSEEDARLNLEVGSPSQERHKFIEH
uniref:Uncharacterized protein n=1 Tax=Plectus sambesii TaxID=2011161 RepID=A0A914UTZ9_9BILA